MSRFIYLHINICLSHTHRHGHIEIPSNKLYLCVCISRVHLFIHTFICFVFRSSYSGASDHPVQKIHIFSSVILRQAKNPQVTSSKRSQNVTYQKAVPRITLYLINNVRYTLFFPSPPFPFPLEIMVKINIRRPTQVSWARRYLDADEGEGG